MPSPTRTLSPAAARRIIAEHAFPRDTRDRVGAEIEWFQAPRPGAERLTVPELRSLLPDRLPSGSTPTFEPGGQVEISTRPCTDVATVCDAAAADAGVVRAALAEHGIDLLAAGFDPAAPTELQTDEARYVAMRAYFDRANGAGGRMMCQTAAIHVNVDAGADAEGARRWRAAHATGPALLAAFANSPSDGWRSARMGAWLHIDRTRTDPATNGAAHPAAWAGYAMRANVMFVRDASAYRPVDGDLPLERWVSDGHPLGYPTEDDVRYHLTTLFPPIRAHGWLELRYLDMLPDPWWRVAVAVSAALVCDPDAAAAAESACAGTESRWREAARDGLRDPKLLDAARRCIDVAIGALDGELRDLTEAFRERFTSRGSDPGTLASTIEEMA